MTEQLGNIGSDVERAYRVMLLLSDGQPNSRTNRDSALAIAVRANITVHNGGALSGL